MQWEWLGAAVAAFVGGGLSGFFGRPAAAARAEQTRARFENRRKLVTDGHALVQEAYANNWSPNEVAEDLRYVALRADLSKSLQARYHVRTSWHTITVVEGNWGHDDLQADIDRLARKWKLT